MNRAPFSRGDLLAIITGMTLLYVIVFACGYYEGVRTRPLPPPVPLSDVAREGFKGQLWDDPNHVFTEVSLSGQLER